MVRKKLALTRRKTNGISYHCQSESMNIAKGHNVKEATSYYYLRLLDYKVTTYVCCFEIMLVFLQLTSASFY